MQASHKNKCPQYKCRKISACCLFGWKSYGGGWRRFVQLETTEQDPSWGHPAATQAWGALGMSHWHNTQCQRETNKGTRSSCMTAVHWYLCPSLPLGNEVRIVINKTVGISFLLGHGRRNTVEWQQFKKILLSSKELKMSTVVKTWGQKTIWKIVKNWEPRGWCNSFVQLRF